MRIGILLLIFNTISFSICTAQIHGVAFWDENKNGDLDKHEKGIEGVLVTNGLQVTKTNSDGTFQLPSRDDNRFITLTTPTAYRCDQFFHRISDNKQAYNFALQKKDTITDHFSFIHITDTETHKNSNNWIEMLQSYIKNEQPDFLIHTGDICYTKGMHFHAENLNSQTMSIPTYYCIGNHDLVKGNYGEELFEKLFGPPWYSFEVGNVHFIVTPMLRGDYKPSYRKADVYHWLKNLLAQLDPSQPKFVFNHDLLTGEDEFIYKISQEEQINLNEHNLKAWVYGHWHSSFYRPHGNSGVVSICTGVAQKGGIDHSLSQFRVFDVQSNGSFNTTLVQSFVDHEMAIVSPAPVSTIRNNELPILVNAYNTTSKTNRLSYQIDSLPEKDLTQITNWTWSGLHPLEIKSQASMEMDIKVRGYFNDGVVKTKALHFKMRNASRKDAANGYWPNMLMNGQHHPGSVNGPAAPLALEWVTNIGGNSYMCSPIVAAGKVFIASYDNGDARNCYIMAYDYKNGKLLWKYHTDNSVKGAIAFDNGHVFATDMVGNVYAINAETGALHWKINLEMEPLPAYVSGTIASNQLIFTGDSQGFSAINQADGTYKWRNTAWRGGVGGPPVPTVGKDFVIASSNWNALYCHDLSTGELLWKNKSDGLRFRDAAPVLYNDTLFLATQQTLMAIHPKTGKILKKEKTKYFFKSNSTPLIFNDLIIIGSGSSGLLAFKRSDFSLAWQFKTGGAISTSTPYAEPPQRTIEASPVIVNNSELFIGASDGKFYCIDAEYGGVIWSMDVGAPIFATIAVAGNHLFMVDIAGNLYCFASD